MQLIIYAVGDIMLGEQPLCYKFGVKSIIKEKGARYIFESFKKIMRDGDIIFGNLEAPISNTTNKKGLEAEFFRGNPAAIEGLKHADFNYVSIANNHIMDHGEKGFLSTIDLLNRNEITPLGVADEIEIIEKKDVNIALLGYSFIEDFADNSYYNKIYSEKEIIEDIIKVRGSADLIVLSLHWGLEYVPFPSIDQIRIGRKLIEAGADIIIGHHPHVIQGYEIYKGKPIIYSLGNFIFDDTYIKSTQTGMLAKIIFDKEYDDIHIDIIPFKSDRKEFCPRLVDIQIEQKILRDMSNLRSLIESNSFSSFQMPNKYRKMARTDMKVHFVKTLFKLPLNLIISLIFVYLKNIFTNSLHNRLTDFNFGR